MPVKVTGERSSSAVVRYTGASSGPRGSNVEEGGHQARPCGRSRGGGTCLSKVPTLWSGLLCGAGRRDSDHGTVKVPGVAAEWKDAPGIARRAYPPSKTAYGDSEGFSMVSILPMSSAGRDSRTRM